MGLVKLAGSFHGIGAAAKYLGNNRTLQHAVIGAGLGAIGGNLASGEGHKGKGALIGGAIGGLAGAGGSILHQGHMVKNIAGGSYKEGLQGALKANKIIFKNTGTAFQAGKAAGTTNLGHPEFIKEFTQRFKT